MPLGLLSKILKKIPAENSDCGFSFIFGKTCLAVEKGVQCNCTETDQTPRSSENRQPATSHGHNRKIGRTKNGNSVFPTENNSISMSFGKKLVTL